MIVTKLNKIQELWTSILATEEKIHSIKDSFLELHKDDLLELERENRLQYMYDSYTPHYSGVSSTYTLEPDDVAHISWDGDTVDILSLGEGIGEQLAEVFETYVANTIRTHEQKILGENYYNEYARCYVLKLKYKASADDDAEVINLGVPMGDEVNIDAVEESSEDSTLIGQGTMLDNVVGFSSVLNQYGIIVTENPLLATQDLRITQLAMRWEDSWSVSNTIFKLPEVSDTFIDFLNNVVQNEVPHPDYVRYVYVDENNGLHAFQTLLEKIVTDAKKAQTHATIDDSLLSPEMDKVVKMIDGVLGTTRIN